QRVGKEVLPAAPKSGGGSAALQDAKRNTGVHFVSVRFQSLEAWGHRHYRCKRIRPWAEEEYWPSSQETLYRQEPAAWRILCQRFQDVVATQQLSGDAWRQG